MNLWNLKAPLYNLFRKPWPLNRILGRETENIKTLLQLIPPQEGTALDIGCGTGRSIKLYKGSINFIGLDGSFNMAKQASQNTNYPVVVADALRPPFSANSFSLVTAVGLLEYLDDLETFFANCAAVLKQGGHLLVTGSPSGLFTSLRRVGGTKIHPRKADVIIEAAERYNFKLVGKKSCFSQDVFLFRVNFT
ncbi:class I SAM-dependent methyltransferase [candidate division KSB1 bacterium]|nr:class I SAM-dependent methyltransferase [candidate division KSB1 bacterium]